MTRQSIILYISVPSVEVEGSTSFISISCKTKYNLVPKSAFTLTLVSRGSGRKFAEWAVVIIRLEIVLMNFGFYDNNQDFV